MSLNNIILSPVTVSAFYQKTLVELDEATITREIPGLPQQEMIVSTINPPPAATDLAGAEPAGAIAGAESSPAPLQYLGKNLKNIVILVHYPDQVYLPEEQLNFLTAILNACRLNMGDIAIFNNARQPITADGLKEALNPRQIVLFGQFNDIVHGAEQFVIKSLDGISVLAAPELETLNNTSENGKLLKGRLWGCLKQLFNV